MTNKKYFMGIRGLIKEDVEFDFEPWHIQEIYKCKNDIEYLLSKYCKVVHQHRGEINFDLYNFQKEFIKTIQNNNRVLGLVPRQAGKTTTIVGYCIHFILFNKNKNVGILADRLQTSRKILATIKDMYKRLPEWLQVGVVEWSKTSVKFANGVKIIADATSENSLVGEAMSLLIVDEVAKISSNVFKDFMDSVMPTISSSPSAKIIMFSTPRGLNHWYKLISDARFKRSNYALFECQWNDVPGRDQSFKDAILADNDESYWLQEFECEFLGSSDSLISMKVLKNLVHLDPNETRYENKFKVYERPAENQQYFLICDYAEGLEQDSSTIQVFRRNIENQFEQVAVYKDNTIKPREFAKIKFYIAEYYNNGLIIGESNSIGEESLNELFELEYENIFYDFDNKNKIGLKQTKKTKSLGCTYLKRNIENNKFKINDFETIQELSTFVKRKNSYEAEEGKHDDLVMPLVTFSYLMNNETFADWYISDNYNVRLNDVEIQRQDLLPNFIYDGEDDITLNTNVTNYEDDEGWSDLM